MKTMRPRLHGVAGGDDTPVERDLAGDDSEDDVPSEYDLEAALEAELDVALVGLEAAELDDAIEGLEAPAAAEPELSPDSPDPPPLPPPLGAPPPPNVPPAVVVEAAALREPADLLKGQNWGVFRSTVRPPVSEGGQGTHGGWSASCPFLWKNARTDCKKRFPHAWGFRERQG